MDKYLSIPTSFPMGWETHSGTCALVGAEMFPEKTSLSELTDDPRIPETYDPDKDDIKIGTASDDFEALVRGLVDMLPYDSVVFNGDVVVMLPPGAKYDEEFMAQIDGDLLRYASVTHRVPSMDVARETFEQTAAWWRAVREEDRADAVMILKALYRLHEMPYPGPGFSGSNSDVQESLVHGGDPEDFAAVTHTWEGKLRSIISIVGARPVPIRKWANDSREYTMATMGRDMLRYCIMQPRVKFVHRKDKAPDKSEAVASDKLTTLLRESLGMIVE